MSLNIKHTMIHSHEDYSAIDLLKKAIESFVESESERLNSKYDSLKQDNEIDFETKDLILETIATDMSVTDRLGRLCDELLILSLYKKVEISILRIFERHYPNRRSDKLYQFKERERLFKKNGSRLEDVTNHAAVDELRCICNAIKHQGKVTSALSIYPGWSKGDDLVGLKEAYTRLAGDVPTYLVNFERKIKPKSNK